MPNSDISSLLGAEPKYEDDMLSPPTADSLYTALENEFSDPNQEGNPFYSAVAAKIMEKFQKAKQDREIHEERWLRAFQNYRGVYGKNVRFRESEKSRVFIKATKNKVLAGYGQLVEIVFGGSSFPLTVQATKLPEGVAEWAHAGEGNTDNNKTADIEGGVLLEDTSPTSSATNAPFSIYNKLGWKRTSSRSYTFKPRDGISTGRN